VAVPYAADLDPDAVAGAGPGVAAVAPPGVPGLMEQGNVDLDHRPIHRNADGSISTVRSMSFADEPGGPEILVPTIADDGTPLDDQQAIDLYHRTGKHLGKFDNPDNATAYAQKLHEAQAKQYLPLANGVAPVNPGAPPPPDTGAAGAPGSGPAQPEPGALPPRPVRPPLTGDPAKDIQSSLGYERALDDWHAQVLGAAGKTQQAVMAEHAAKQLANEQALQKQHEELRQRQQAEREQYQRDVIGNATKERASAMGALENGTWRGDPHSGTKIAALILGAVGAGFSAAGGHPTGNLAAEAIDKIQQREYDAAKNRLASANEHALQARYGFKDLQENQRAALNDLDADFAAKNHLIAAEAENALRQRGASPEDIANHGLVQQALAKSAAYEDQIHQRELEEQRKQAVDAEKAKLDTSTMRRNNAQADAAEALAGFRNRRGAGGAGKGGAGAGAGARSKAELKAESDELKAIEKAATPYINNQLGSAKSPGTLKAYESAQAVSNEIRRAVASGDPNAIKIAVMHAQEQSTRFLTNAAPTQQTFAIQHELAGAPEQLEAKLSGLLGQPAEAKGYALRMAQNIDAIARQRKEVLDATAGEAETRLSSIAKSDEGKKRMKGILDSLRGKRADSAAAAKPTQVIGGATYEFGEDGNWHKVKAPAKEGDIKL
jgi:hypothetical protein